MPIGLAIASLVALFISFWALHVARDPRLWRLWWMDLIGVLDMDADRELRRSQEGQMSFICYTLFALLLVTSLSGAFWTFDLIQEHKRDKTRYEREIARSNQEIDKVSSKTQGLKR